MEKKGKEEELYEPAGLLLKKLFSPLGTVHFEITSRGIFSPDLKERLDDVSLHIIDREGIYPDLMGFILSSGPIPLVVAEVKDEELKLKDIGQARTYGVVYSAQYDVLLTTKPVPEQIKRWYFERRSNLGIFTGYESVRIARLNTRVSTPQHSNTTMEIDGKTWIPSPPFTPGCPYCKSERSNWNRESRRFDCGNCKKAHEMPSVEVVKDIPYLGWN